MSAAAPLISIVTVTWNLLQAGREQLFKDALACVQSQTFRDVEHIILDGASDDGTVAMIEAAVAQYASQPQAIPLTLVSEPDDGLYDAINKAIALARGNYVVILNSDDLFCGVDTLEQISAKIGNARPPFVYGATMREREDGSRFLSAKMNPKAFLQRVPFGTNSMALRRDVVLELGGFTQTYPLAADFEFILRLLSADIEGVRLDAPVSLFRVGGLSSDELKLEQDFIDIWRDFLAGYVDMSRYSDEELRRWYRSGCMPVSFLIALARTPKARSSKQLMRAIRHSLGRSLRRALQPWRD